MRDPSFSVLYGDLKFGKTADALAAFPAAIYVAAPGALAPAETLWGFSQPDYRDLGTFKEIREFAEKLGPNSAPALVIDDATLIADRTAIYYRDVKHLTGWDVWGAVVNSAVKMRDSLRRRGMHVVMTAHAGAAYNENGVRQRGGPSFQGQARKKLPAAADLLLRAEPISAPFGFWPYCYRTAPHPDWLQGSRYDTPDMAPMNLREILNLAGFALPRLKGLEWQETIANGLANKVLEAWGDEEKVKGWLMKTRDALLAKKFDQRHVKWAIRDGYDRAVLRVAQRAAQWGF